MKTPDDISIIMTEVGPLDENILAVLRTGDESWAIRFEAVDVEAEFDPAGGRLMLSTTVGVPPPPRAATVYETLLTYSTAWRETGGVRMGLSRPGGELVQMADIVAADITPALVVTMAVNLAERSLYWRGYVEGSEADDDTAAAPAANFPEDNFIRI